MCKDEEHKKTEEKLLATLDKAYVFFVISRAHNELKNKENGAVDPDT